MPEFFHIHESGIFRNFGSERGIAAGAAIVIKVLFLGGIGQAKKLGAGRQRISNYRRIDAMVGDASKAPSLIRGAELGNEGVLVVLKSRQVEYWNGALVHGSILARKQHPPGQFQAGLLQQ